MNNLSSRLNLERKIFIYAQVNENVISDMLRNLAEWYLDKNSPATFLFLNNKYVHCVQTYIVCQCTSLILCLAFPKKLFHQDIIECWFSDELLFALSESARRMHIKCSNLAHDYFDAVGIDCASRPAAPNLWGYQLYSFFFLFENDKTRSNVKFIISITANWAERTLTKTLVHFSAIKSATLNYFILSERGS